MIQFRGGTLMHCSKVQLEFFFFKNQRIVWYFYPFQGTTEQFCFYRTVLVQLINSCQVLLTMQCSNWVSKLSLIRKLVSEKGKGNFLTFIYHNQQMIQPLIQTWVFTFFVISSENPQKEVPSIKIVVTYVVIFSIERKRPNYTIAAM